MNVNSTPCLKSELLVQAGFEHGFFTRQGGVSSPPFDSLNLSTQVGDPPEMVLQNRKRVAQSLGILEKHLYYPRQVHGVNCLIVSHQTRQQEFETHAADSVLSNSAGVGAAVRTADCVPILIGERSGRWVAAVHAGWRGCAQDAVGVAIAHLQAQGAKQFIAAIGPHISSSSFEVDEKTASELLQSSPDTTIVDRSYSKPHVDLRKMVRSQLRQAGLNDEQIDDVHGCTVQEPQRFFSHRRDATASGRQVSVIVPQKPRS